MADNKLPPEPEEEPLTLEIEEEEPQVEPISLEEEGEAARSGPAPSLRAADSGLQKHGKEMTFRRPLNNSGKGATRCRVFHSKIAVASMEYMQNQINEWIDTGDIDVKHVGHVIGVLEGKTPEPNVILVVWY